MPEKLLGSGFDWSLVDQFKKMLKTQPKLVTQLVMEWLKSKGVVTKQTQPVFTLISEQISDNPDAVEYIFSFVDSLEVFFKAESGKRFLRIIPALMTADSETALELFAREADYNQEAFFNLLKNDDMANHFLKKVSRFFIGTFQWCKAAMDDNLKFAIFNGMLISNGFPAVDRRNLMKSTIAIIEKGMKLFTTVRYDGNLYREVKHSSTEFENSKICTSNSTISPN